MKRIKLKTISGWLAVVLIFLSLTACSSYRADVPANDITDAIKQAVGSSEDYYDASDDTYEIYFGDDSAYVSLEDASIVYHTVGTNVNSFGVFHVSEGENVNAVRTMVQNYVDDQQVYLNSFAANYNQDELSKIENAQVNVVGNYVYFTILTKEDTDKVKQVVMECIAK